MDGIINLNKPAGITSAKALYRVRSITRQRKSGHAGTLDPSATGVLVLCLGRGTKLVESVMDQPKVYRATARLDVTSESLDADRPLHAVEIANQPSQDAIHQALATFEGEIEQVPPQVSAVKVNGVPAYRLRRSGAHVPLKPKVVSIYWLHLHRYDWPEIEIEMCCGRGTYVRSVIRDLGERLKTGGCLTALVRSRVGPFSASNAWTFETIEQATDWSDCLIELDQAKRLLDPAALVIPPRPAMNESDC